MSSEYMPTDMQYKDDLRKQRDNWSDIITELESSPNKENDLHIKGALKLARREYNRIIESLQD